MIAVDVYVPYLGETYDFSLDETVPIASLIDEIVAMICSKERWPTPASTSELRLFAPKQSRELPCVSTLAHEKVDAGQSLILC